MSVSKMRMGVALAVLSAAHGFSGCNRLEDYEAADLSDRTKRHAIGYSARAEALYVEVPRSGEGLSDNQSADVWRFIDRYKKESTGTLRVSAPKSAGGHLAVSQALRDVEGVMRDQGLDPGAVEMSRTAAASPHGPAIKLAYDKPVAVGPRCGDWQTDLGENRERLPYNDYGCATQRNLAMTVANSRDLEMPQEETPASAERRGTVWSKYTSSPGASSGGGGSSGGGDMAPAPAAPGKN